MMYREYAGVNERAQATLAGQVFGLLGFSLLFTMGGALLAPRLGPGAFIMSLVGSFGALIALMFLKDKSPINLGLFYLFSVAEGLLLGLVVESYFAAGRGMIVANAAATTAALVLALSAYAWTTKRDLSGIGSFLMIALLGVIIASLINLFLLHAPMLSLLISAATAVIFSGFVLYDMQRLRGAKGGTGDAIMFAVAIYLDIFNLFLSLLQILGFLGGRED
ncbi:MAG TPA: Bax inhibitor-1/YccA family protein [Chloroflexota bacterium]|nr:Bax inhibitor-1/YccA family protein [Chloroflexota bacterium]